MEASTAPARSLHAPRLVSPRLLRAASDDRLVGLVRSGNESAFEAIYDRHHRPLLSFCRHMLSSREESEDAVQQTFLAAYNDLVGSVKAIQLRPWLYAIARNRCLSMLRARREQATGEDLEIATEGLAEQVERRADLQELLGDLRGLPDDQRAALVLAEIGALGHDEIASVIDVPKPKVKALVFQARESLMGSRAAREVSCRQIREELATARGAALRRAPLRRHLKECAGCREFRAQVGHQRAAMALVLPVIPTLALKQGAMPAAIAAKIGGGGAAAGGGVAAAGAKGIVAKVLAVAALAGAGAAGSVAVVSELGDSKTAQAAKPGAGATDARSTLPIVNLLSGRAVLPVRAHRAAPAARTRVAAHRSSRSSAARGAHHGGHRAHPTPHRPHRGSGGTTSAPSSSGSGGAPGAVSPTHSSSHHQHGAGHPAHPSHPVHPVHPVHPPHPTHPPHPVHPVTPVGNGNGHAYGHDEEHHKHHGHD
ncbi:MAG: hypothetical protein QOK31_816 [Solirubrobacteraceae bacterium]|nr:hypothetical protein [Solirubrobacteraceae bacterium]